MSLEKVRDTKNLNIDQVTIGVRFEAIAYLMDAKTRFTERAGGFIVFYLKDEMSRLVVGRMFSVENFIESGLQLAQLRRRAVKIVGTPANFDGGKSLHIESITIYDGPVEIERFVGKISTASEDIKVAEQLINEYVQSNITLPYEYTVDSYVELFHGASGGYARFSKLVLEDLRKFFELPTVVPRVLVESTFYVLRFYSRYLNTYARIDAPLKSEILKEIYTMVLPIENVNCTNTVVDACSALVGLGKPSILYSHLIVKTMENIRNLTNFCYEASLIPIGSSKQIGGEQLSRL